MSLVELCCLSKKLRYSGFFSPFPLLFQMLPRYYSRLRSRGQGGETYSRDLKEDTSELGPSVQMIQWEKWGQLLSCSCVYGSREQSSVPSSGAAGSFPETGSSPQAQVLVTSLSRVVFPIRPWVLHPWPQTAQPLHPGPSPWWLGLAKQWTSASPTSLGPSTWQGGDFLWGLNWELFSCPISAGCWGRVFGSFISLIWNVVFKN